MTTPTSQDTYNPNELRYAAKSNGKYLSTRILTHCGTTIAFALGITQDAGALFFDYSILNATDQDPAAQSKNRDESEKLDSQCWLDNVRPIRFPSEVRVVGEEAVPSYELPAVDRTGRRVSREHVEKLDMWTSTSLCLMDPTVTNFEVLSDGKYIYLFRQSRSASDKFLDRFGQTSTTRPPIDGNLLCDRFNLVGSTLNRTLEVRFRRSQQKRLPLNDRDTLGVRDINDVPFYDPTFSLRFVRDMDGGRFSILQTPTVTSGISKWMIFAFSKRTLQIECFTTDVGSDGLFDLLGQNYYTCEGPGHEATFSTAPGKCSAINKDHGEICNLVRTTIVPKNALSERAILLGDVEFGPDLSLKQPIDLSSTQFSRGFTLEAWVNPFSFWIDHVAALKIEDQNMKVDNDESHIPPRGSQFSLFRLAPDTQETSTYPLVYLDDHLRLVLRLDGQKDSVVATTEQALKADAWNHVAIVYTAGQSHTIQMILNGESSGSKATRLSDTTKPGYLASFVSQSPDVDERFQGQLDEIRLWGYPLHPETIKSRMSTRAMGLEPFLEAYWHCDEGTGAKLYDATPNAHDVDIKLKIITEDQKKPEPPIWTMSTAPLRNGFGLARRKIRLPSEINVCGGMNASIYYEQVSVKQPDYREATESADTMPKPLKRAARILFCFVARKADKEPSYLAVVDFGLLSDGTLCDWPAIIPLPSLTVSTQENTAKSLAPTSILYTDAQGFQLFGGFLQFDAAKSDLDAPFVWDSSTGTVTIFFRGLSGSVSALIYDISRTVKPIPVDGLGEFSGLLATCKLRQVRVLHVWTEKCNFAPESVAINVRLFAKMDDDTVAPIIEHWQGMPTNVERFCSILNGVDESQTKELGELSRGLEPVLDTALNVQAFEFLYLNLSSTGWPHLLAS